MSLGATLRSAETSARGRLSRIPLQARLLGIVLVLLVTALAATGVATQFILRVYLVGQVDQQLKDNGAEIATTAINARADVLIPSVVVTTPFMSDYVVNLSTKGSAPVTIKSSGNDPQPVFPELTQAEIAERTGSYDEVPDAQDPTETWRVLTVLYSSDATGPVYTQVALPLEGVDQAVKRLQVLVLGLGGIVIVVCMLLGWLAIRRAFQPLRDVETTAAAIAAGDLSQRVPTEPPGTEVGRLTTSLNRMLGRIEEAFDARAASEARTRRFAADASHELRTPLASIRGFAELYRQGAVSEPEDVARTMSRIEDEARRMGSLVDDLLLLARVDEARPGRHDEVDLAVLAGDAVLDARGLDTQRDVRLVGLTEGTGPRPSLVHGDEDRLRQVVANLVGNAVRHTPAGSPLEVAVGVDDASEQAVLEVRDHGNGLAPDVRERVFERFYRVDSSRTRGRGGGSGLGLSIVSAVVHAHGGRVDVYETSGGGATFRVELPHTA